jgi:phosphoglycolate phosphatase-like HAD superfamily hydrolase
VDSARTGLDAFIDAFAALEGEVPHDFPSFAGRTDLEIAHSLFEVNGIEPTDDLVARFEQQLHRAMRALAADLRERGSAMPGALRAVERLAVEKGVVQSLLTGNIAPNARIKLEPFGFLPHLDFEVGAYGSDHRVRGELVAIARGRAEEKHGRPVHPHQVVLVGDTPLDIAAAHQGGARAVGVATGPFGRQELEAAGADDVLTDLSDTPRVLKALLAPT